MNYHQCSFREVVKSGGEEGGGAPARQTVAWIEERGAKCGAHVELLEFGKGSFFEVLHVGKLAVSGKELREKQNADRNAFASIVTA